MKTSAAILAISAATCFSAETWTNIVRPPTAVITYGENSPGTFLACWNPTTMNAITFGALRVSVSNTTSNTSNGWCVFGNSGTDNGMLMYSALKTAVTNNVSVQISADPDIATHPFWGYKLMSVGLIRP